MTSDTGDLVPAPNPAPFALPEGYDAIAESRRLLRMIRAGALATIDETGAPFATLVNVATAADGAPVLLLSRLSRHTRLLEADGRCSILLAQGGKGDPLAHPRLTVTGEARRDSDPELRRRFLARHPKSALYADFGDFSFWRVTPSGFHLNGGFARAADFAAGTILLSGALDGEAQLLDWINGEFRAGLPRLAALAGEENGPWRASGLDAEGLDLLAGDRTARLVFPSLANGADQARAMLTRLAEAGPGSGMKNP